MPESSAPSARATHAAIRRVALSLFETEGYANVTVAQVAASAGVDPMTVYRHFGTKHGLVLRLGDDLGTPQRLGEAFAAVARPGGSLLDAVEATAAQWVEQASTELLDEAFRVVRLTATTPELRNQAWNNVTAWAETYQPWVAELMPDVEPPQAELASRIAIDVVVAAGLVWATSSGDKAAALAALRSMIAVARRVSRG
ncbi:TetR/AcrR family transcriptional regulator [Propionibacteriaceae bacterium Y2011]